jgi:hypothetical protein
MAPSSGRQRERLESMQYNRTFWRVTMKSLTRKIPALVAALAITCGTMFVAPAKANAAVYICGYVGTLNGVDYYYCTRLYPN